MKIVMEQATPAVERQRWAFAGASLRGVAHVLDGLPNQDAIASWMPSTGATLPAVVAISDGHGALRHFRSDAGARIAVEVTVSVLRELAHHLDAVDDATRSRVAAVELPLRIVGLWKERVRRHLIATPFTDAEWQRMAEVEGRTAREAVQADPLLAYGATLLAALATERCLVLTQLGDGDVLAVAPDGSTVRPLPTDERLTGNFTTSLCRPGAESDFRTVVLGTDRSRPSLLLLCTDGYANSFATDADFLRVAHDFREMVQQDGMEAVQRQLSNILEHASENGSGDDITVSLLYRVGSEASEVEPATSDPAGNNVLPAHENVVREVAQTKRLHEALAVAEQRIGLLKRGLVGAIIVAVAALVWAIKDRLF